MTNAPMKKILTRTLTLSAIAIGLIPGAAELVQALLDNGHQLRSGRGRLLQVRQRGGAGSRVQAQLHRP